MKLPIVLTALAVVSLAPTFQREASATALTVNLTSIADTFLSANNPGLNYGAAGALQVSAPGSSKGEMQSLVKFDATSAVTQFNAQFGVGQWAITTATLQTGSNFPVQGSQPNNPIFDPINSGNFNIIWMINDSWLEGTGTPAGGTTDGVTYNTLSTFFSAGDQSLGSFHWAAPSSGTNLISTWTLPLNTSFISDIDSADKVSLRFAAADTAVSYLFNSKSFSSANAPTLILTADAVPEPASLSLLLGSAVLLLRKRRHHA